MPPVQPFLALAGHFTHLFTGAIQKSSSENMARARAAPSTSNRQSDHSRPRTGGLKGAKNGKSRSEWPPFPPQKKARSRRRVLCLGSSSLGFHGQPQGGESRADTKRAPVALILASRLRIRVAGRPLSPRPGQSPAARAGLGRNVEASRWNVEAPPQQPGRNAAPPRRAQMERETPRRSAEPSSSGQAPRGRASYGDTEAGGAAA